MHVGYTADKDGWMILTFSDNQGPEEEIDLTAQPMEIEEEKPADEDTGDMEVDQNGKRERCMLLPQSPLMCANLYLEPRYC